MRKVQLNVTNQISNTLSPYISAWSVKAETAAFPNLSLALNNQSASKEEPISKGAIPIMDFIKIPPELRIVFVIILYPLAFSAYLISEDHANNAPNPSMTSACFTVDSVLIVKKIDPMTWRISPKIMKKVQKLNN